MKKERHTNLISSVVVTGLILSSPFLLDLRDPILLILGFVALQMIMGLTSVLLVLMRVTDLFKNKRSWFYCFTGTFQISLFITDLILLITSHTVMKNSMIVFMGLNTLFASVIFYVIYQPPRRKSGYAEADLSQTSVDCRMESVNENEL